MRSVGTVSTTHGMEEAEWLWTWQLDGRRGWTRSRQSKAD